ncbi:hypothetical protein N7456_004913 [Penicillium angulare]|uniref:Uncharacterized protein n=1 Tax=Penicillium angulare TaxID=116970 RepID=A0A9W9KK07_9EURO|nr:hypothetical protein N7456_004913 [Penicillium angulare]
MPQLSFKDSCDPSDAHESSKRLPSSHDSKERESRDAFQAFEIPGENTASRADLEQGRWINDTLASEKLWSEQRGSPAGGNAHVTLKELDSLLLF